MYFSFSQFRGGRRRLRAVNDQLFFLIDLQFQLLNSLTRVNNFASLQVYFQISGNLPTKYQSTAQEYQIRGIPFKFDLDIHFSSVLNITAALHKAGYVSQST